LKLPLGTADSHQYMFIAISGHFSGLDLQRIDLYRIDLHRLDVLLFMAQAILTDFPTFWLIKQPLVA